MRRRSALLILSLLAAVPAAAQVRAGDEVLVGSNPSFFRDTYTPVVAAGESGEWVAVWVYPPQPLPGLVVVGRRFDALGTPLNSFMVSGPLLLGEPALAVRSGHGFVVVWSQSTASDADVFGRRFDAAGADVGTIFPINEWTTGGQGSVGIAPGPGGYVVVWQGGEQDGSGTGIFGRRLDGTGSPMGAEFAVNTYTTGAQGEPAVAVRGGGDFLVVWEGEGQDGDAKGVFAQRFAADAVAVGAEFQVNVTTAGAQRYPAVASVADGFVVVWDDADAVSARLLGRRIDAAGAPLGDEFLVHAFTTTIGRYRHSLTADTSGSFTAVWSALEDGDGFGVMARRFEADGTPRGPAFVVNAYTSNQQTDPSATSDGNGNLVVVWRTSTVPFQPIDIKGQRFGGLFPRALAVDTSAGAGSDGNGVLEAGETVDVRPSWRNDNGADQAFDGALALSGPAGGAYSVEDAVAAYGAVPTATTQRCADCYQVTVSGTRPAQHWDAVGTEAIVPDAQGQRTRWPLHVGASFGDVPRGTPFYSFVETLLHHGVTGGCEPGLYCPMSLTTRAQMAVFVLAAREGAAYVPPVCAVPPFPDVPVTSGFCPWIAEVARRGVVAGCDDANYCPGGLVARQEMAVFALATLDPAFSPPPCTSPPFADVATGSPFCPHIAELARRGVVSGCGAGNYCPAAPVARQEVAVFIAGTFGLTLYGP